MAILFVDNLSAGNKNRMLHSTVRILELILLLAGAITTLLMVKGAVIPYSCEIVFTSLIGFWNSIKCLLSSPLYICIIINLMVVLIAVSSNFQYHENLCDNDGIYVRLDEHEIQFFQPSQPPVRSTKITTMYTNKDVSRKLSHNYEERSFFPNQDLTKELKKTTRSLKLKSESMKPEMGIKVTDCHSNQNEHEAEDTIDATWKLITGGENQKPNKKELKKSDTWTNNVEPRGLDCNEVVQSAKRKELRKSETFNDTVSVTRHGGLRRDPSESLDEFNNQVEAFIKKFNADMRLQRQESDQRFLEMINQGL